MVENAIFTTLCMVEDGKGNVLVQERTKGNWQGIAFPGGHVEPGESFVKSVIREIYEETGYTIKNPCLCGIKQFPTENKNHVRYVILMFKANKFYGELQSSDEGRAFWIRYDELNQYDLAHDMTEMLAIFKDDSKSEFYYYRDESGEWHYEIF